MGRPKLSPWIDGTVRPVRVGVYQRISRYYSFWDGECWGVDCVTRKLAKTLCVRASLQNVPWRGRAKP